MLWRIYYGDDSAFSDRDGSPFDAPATNVQAIVKRADNASGFVIGQGKDAYYWHRDNLWMPCDMMGLYDYLMFYKGPKAVLFGRTIRDKDFWACVDRATKEGLG
jgi:hypothetical protein